MKKKLNLSFPVSFFVRMRELSLKSYEALVLIIFNGLPTILSLITNIIGAKSARVSRFFP